MKQDLNMDKTIFNITLNLYLKSINKTSDDISSIFKKEWYEIDDYHLKSSILNEAMDKKISITETSYYKNYFNRNRD